MILGGNLIGGYSHSRDLIYGSQLFKAYNTDSKVFETLELAERAGINTFCADPNELPLFSKYRELNSSKMQTLVQVWGHPKATYLKGTVDKAIDYGGSMLYVRGVEADILNVGMFDFQVVENVNVAIDVLSNLKGRVRPWYA